jgi:hypothetical protein
MLKLALAALLALPLALVGAVFSTGLAVVDVMEGGPGGHHIIVPVPLLAVQLGLAFVPAEKLRVDLGRHVSDVAEPLQVARDMLLALADAPDGELVRVEEPGEQVLITKQGDLLRIRVHGGSDDVSVNVPIETVLEVLPRQGRSLDAMALVGALRSLGPTDLVEVHSGGDHVRVTIW